MERVTQQVSGGAETSFGVLCQFNFPFLQVLPLLLWRQKAL